MHVFVTMVCSCTHVQFFSFVPLDGATIENKTDDFLRTYYCDFLNNVYRELGSLVVIGNRSCRYCSASELAMLLISSSFFLFSNDLCPMYFL